MVSAKAIRIFAALVFAASCDTQPDRAQERVTFEPPDGKVLVFVGQDNRSVGGTAEFDDGYVDHVGVPAGITHYIYMVENKSNRYGHAFAAGRSEGLNQVDDWGAGPMCLRCYLESKKLAGTVIALAISLEFGGDRDMAAGRSDHLIAELADFLEEFSDRAFLLRIGYEFEGPWNGYDPWAYAESFRRIVDGLGARGLRNFATVMQSATPLLEREVWERYWPGEGYVDWIGYSYWGGPVPDDAPAFRFAAHHDKPLFVAESAPRGHLLPETDGASLWADWFETYFGHVERNSRIKAISYINCHWESQEMWSVEEWGAPGKRRWGDTRIETNPAIRERWLRVMATERYLHGTDGLNAVIGTSGR